MFNPALIRDAIRGAGLTVPVDFTVGGVAFPGIAVKWFQPDHLYADGFSQQTDYHIEFWTEDLPSLKKGDQLVADGAVYEVADTPAFSLGKSGGHYSTVRLERTSRSYPKVAITHAVSLPGPSPAPVPGSNTADDPPINFAYGDVPLRLIMPLVGAHVIQRVTVVVDQAFNGVGASLAIGTLAAPDLLFAANRIDLAVVAEFEVGGGQVVAAPSAIYLTLNPGVAATQGAGRIFIERVPQL